MKEINLRNALFFLGIGLSLVVSMLLLHGPTYRPAVDSPLVILIPFAGLILTFLGGFGLWQWFIKRKILPKFYGPPEDVKEPQEKLDVLVYSQKQLVQQLEQLHNYYHRTWLPLIPLGILALLTWGSVVIETLFQRPELLPAFIFLIIIITFLGGKVARSQYHFLKVSNRYLQTVKQANLRSEFAMGLSTYLDLLVEQFTAFLDVSDLQGNREERIKKIDRIIIRTMTSLWIVPFLFIFWITSVYQWVVFNPTQNWFIPLLIILAVAIIIVISLIDQPKYLRMLRNLAVALSHTHEWLDQIEGEQSTSKESPRA